MVKYIRLNLFVIMMMVIFILDQQLNNIYVKELMNIDVVINNGKIINTTKFRFLKYLISILLIEQCQIVLIENVNAKSKDELLSREKHYIKSVKCVNKCIPGRTKKEYYETHKEEKKLYAQEYINNEINFFLKKI